MLFMIVSIHLAQKHLDKIKKGTNMTEHELIKKNAIEAVEKVFGDTSVDQQTTIDSLREIMDNCNGFITSIEADMENQAETDEDDG